MMVYAFRVKIGSSSGSGALSIRQKLSFVMVYASIQIMYAIRFRFGKNGGTYVSSGQMRKRQWCRHIGNICVCSLSVPLQYR